MHSTDENIFTRGLGWALSLATVVYAVAQILVRPAQFADFLPTLSLLLLAATAAATLLSAVRSNRSPRLALAFVIAAYAVTPAPGALLVALVAAAVAGSPVVGMRARASCAIAAALVAIALAQYFASPAAPAAAFSGGLLLRFVMLFVVIQAFATALGLALDPASVRSDPGALLAHGRLLLAEAVSIPLAWILASFIVRNELLPAAVTAVLILLALAALLHLERLSLRLRESHAAVGSRLAELSTLHAIGREILSSIEPERVFATLDRECRKIFDIDHCFIALVDPESTLLRAVYRHCRGSRPEHVGEPIERGIAEWVAREKRARRVDDLTAPGVDAALAGDMIAAETRSIMAVPLIVEDRVTGVLCVQSARVGAYDEHQVAVLTTIAQQAAVAIENARHYHLATVDSLTGFFARDYFFRRLGEEDKRVRRYGGQFALLMVDLDGFKEINDKNGHLAGDRYLSEIAATIGEQLRAADLACRYGGDEFCLLLPETELAGAQTIAERIRDAVARRIVGIEGLALRTTVSIGVAVYPDHDSGDMFGLMRNADEALYRAKRNGRDRVVPFAA